MLLIPDVETSQLPHLSAPYRIALSDRVARKFFSRISSRYQTHSTIPITVHIHLSLR